MSLSRDLASGTTTSELEAVGTKTATDAGTALDITTFTGVGLVVLHSALGTGNADNTMNCKVQESATSGGTYTDVTGATFVEVDDTAGGSIQGISLDCNASLGFIKLVATIAGTTPSFVYSSSFIARKEKI